MNSISQEQVLLDMVRLCEKRCEPCYSDFLSEDEVLTAQNILKHHACENYFFWGGFRNAKRVMLCVYPDEYSKPETSNFPLCRMNLKYRKNANLTHRDFLGSLMGAGIKRNAVGDIIISENSASFFVKKELESYVRSQIEKVGREGVEFCNDIIDLNTVVQQFKEKSGTVSSLRLDAVISECTGLSRSKTQQIIKSGCAMVNAVTICDCDHRIEDNDKISVRGHGKFIICFDGGMSKKNKYKINIKKYI